MYFLTFETNGAPFLHDVCGRDKAALYAILYGAARAEISRPPFTNGCRCFAVSGEIFCAETRSAPLPILLRSRQGARHSLPCKRAAYAAAIATTTLRSRSGGNKPTAVRNGGRCLAVSGEIFCAETRSAPLPILLRSWQGARRGLPCKRAVYTVAIGTTCF